MGRGCPEKQCPQGYKSAADKTYTAGGYGFLSKRPCLHRPNTRIPAATEARTNTACTLRHRRNVVPIPSVFADNPLSRPHAICRGWWRHRKLKPTGPEGFDGLMAAVLTDLTKRTFALASSGSQRGKDGQSALDGAIAFEGKLYEDAVAKDQILSKIAEIAGDEEGETELWILGSTGPASTSTPRKGPV